MATRGLNVVEFLDLREGLPHPQWELVRLTIEGQFREAEQQAAWVQFVRDWFDELADALPDVYSQGESQHFLILGPDRDGLLSFLLETAEASRAALLGILPALARFDVPGKQIVVALGNRDSYYQYIAPHYPEGEFGDSAGIQLREFHPQIALWIRHDGTHHATLAHEMLHASVMHLELPLWIEEGLAQMFEQDIGGRSAIQLERDKIAKQKTYWKKHGLDCFWLGEGFQSPDEQQEYCYSLAEILMRLLIEDHKPTWFGLVREPQIRLMNFLRYAHRDDCGAQAAQEHLGCDLSEIAEKFLGFGDWGPKT